MTLQNRQLIRHTQKTDDGDLPSMYDSKLFARQHPNKEGSQYSKSSEDKLPDPQLEDLQTDEEDLCSDTKKAINILKSFQKAEPDTTGKYEGKFKVPLQSMISHLNEIVSAEYSQWMRWYHYGIVLRGHCRDAIAEEFEKHAEEELGHAESVAMRIIGLGGYPSTDLEQPIPLKDTEEILKELLLREQKGMELYRKIHSLCGDNEGTRQILEGNMGMEQEHIDDLWRFLNHPDLIKAGTDQESAGRQTVTEGQSNRGYSRDFARVAPGGISGSSNPDFPWRGRVWHKEDEEKEEESEDGNFDKKPKNLLENKDYSANKEAMKALSNVPCFSSSSSINPKEKDFMLENGYTEEEIEGGAQLTPRLRAMFNRFLRDQVSKSVSSLLK
jgi:bacterioferritin